jgi:segregation and condensation protein B
VSPESEARADVVRELEAVFFAAGRPLDLDGLVRVVCRDDRANRADVEAALAWLESEYAVDGPRGFELARVGGGWLLRTNRECVDALGVLFSTGEDGRLSPAAMETLAIIAYLQPVSRPQIAEIRGVQSESAVQTLIDRELVAEHGRSDAPGAAVLYGTTERFLVVFGLDGLQELRPLEGFAMDEEQVEELRRRLGLMVAPE